MSRVRNSLNKTDAMNAMFRCKYSQGPRPCSVLRLACCPSHQFCFSINFYTTTLEKFATLVQKEEKASVVSASRLALEDNSAGYDLQSYEQTEFGLKNLLIEVKSSQRSPPRMVLTRGEWEAAAKYGDAYMFHLWQFPAEKLTVMTAVDIAQHIPGDHGKGRWTELEIQF